MPTVETRWEARIESIVDDKTAKPPGVGVVMRPVSHELLSQERNLRELQEEAATLPAAIQDAKQAGDVSSAAELTVRAAVIDDVIRIMEGKRGELAAAIQAATLARRTAYDVRAEAEQKAQIARTELQRAQERAHDAEVQLGEADNAEGKAVLAEIDLQRQYLRLTGEEYAEPASAPKAARR